MSRKEKPSLFDFAEAWRSLAEQDPKCRYTREEDLAHWERRAVRYAEEACLPGRYEATLAALTELVRPTDTLLDVGAGAGRFALPLAAHVQQVTALDQAAPMLDILRAKADAEGIANVQLLRAAWEDATVEPHDVVLAAWSLYRQPDLVVSMQKLIAATRRTLVIVAGTDDSIRGNPKLGRFWPQAEDGRRPMHLYLYGALWQAGVYPDLRIVYEQNQVTGATPLEVAQALAPANASGSEVEGFCAAITPELEETSSGWRYIRPEPVALIVWQRL
ncbi:MAG: class I SAM-dependent methyltransferase [Caldilineaceae bacterium]|nr:class I SAM-dependent methyltransferase [Caldilineaceae bacterium]